MPQGPIIPLKHISTKYRVSMIFIDYSRINVKDGALVAFKEGSGKFSDAISHSGSVNWLLFPIKGY
jgi:hypothetical protein